MYLGEKISDKISVTELNAISLNSMPDRWIKKAYVQGFDCKFIASKKAVNMFKGMKIVEFKL